MCTIKLLLKYADNLIMRAHNLVASSTDTAAATGIAGELLQTPLLKPQL
jgi:hypothetical protein